MGYRGIPWWCAGKMCRKGRNMFSFQIIPQLFPQNQLVSRSNWGWGGDAGGVQEGCEEENQARIGNREQARY